MMRRRLTGISVAVAAALIAGPAGAAVAASNWNVGLNAGSNSLARSDIAPTAPTLTATCDATAKSIVLNWTAVSHSTYDIFRSTDGSSYSKIVAGASATTYTDGSLANVTYYYEVQAKVSVNWVGPMSAPGSRTIQGGNCT